MIKWNGSEAIKLVTVAYITLLNRNPDKEGLKYYMAKLMAGELDELGLTYAIMTSDEYQQSMKKKERNYIE